MRDFWEKRNNSKQFKELQQISGEIESLSESLACLSDAGLAAKTAEFRQQLQEGFSLEEILPEAYGVVREASARVLGMRHFPVQLMGGIAFHRGMFVEMKTGEGKTITAVLPAYLNALAGEGVHIVTANEYLSRRDSSEMGAVFRFLGLSTGCLTTSLTAQERQKAYACDVTYGTASEFGFDYLRDNLALDLSGTVQRGHPYAIIDEVDSILIDEARTPLIIADKTFEDTGLCLAADRTVRQLSENIHYEVDLKERTVYLTDEGITACEKLLGLNNLVALSNMGIYHSLLQVLKAHALYQKDVHYIVKSGTEGPEVTIIDQFTGRPMAGRRYVNSLHQAIEAKEGVAVRKEKRTAATISIQNYFRRYEKLAGMSGTLMSDTRELAEVYGVETLELPTNKPVIRQDDEDRVFLTQREKLQEVVKDIKEKHRLGRPVLVGTLNIRQSEEVCALLKAEEIPHVLLNARTLEQEAAIIAQAGRQGAVTVATNLAGRGTDIKLGPGVAGLGGLHVIGTTRHEARRIDHQLRGRAGRQGDPGSSRFYISLEDDLMLRCSQEAADRSLNGAGVSDPVRPASGEDKAQEKKLAQLVQKAQRQVESRNSDIRKRLLEFDDVLNCQRETIYNRRRQILVGSDTKEAVCGIIRQTVQAIADKHVPVLPGQAEWNPVGVMVAMHRVFRRVRQLKITGLPELTRDGLAEELMKQALDAYLELEKSAGPEYMRQRERQVLLGMIGRSWAEHIDTMEQLRQGIALRAYGRDRPIQAYIREGWELFEQMGEEIRQETAALLFARSNEHSF